MYCPRCGVQNVDDARFCRACGADISLVPQALTGRLPERYAPAEPEELNRHESRRRRRRREREKEPPTVARGVERMIGGLGFILVALSIWLFAPGGHLWFFWFFIPAFFSLADGAQIYLRARDMQRQQYGGLPPTAPAVNQVRPAARLNELPSRETAEMLTPPGSVTEGTTRHLDALDRKR